ncbi:MAG TPA: LytR C-terminal domain-containing protein, partial [Baekduia sp.]|nr:LytR C-terminal domain-containing protein [Baekduia sp.]
GVAAGVGGDGPSRHGSAAGTTTTAKATAPDSFTTAVLNGTAVPGLARGVANRLQNAGFKIGNVTNASSQRRTRTVIYFAREDSVPAATQVAQALILGKTNLRQMTEGVRTIAGDEASVVVLVGSDQNTSPTP